jgi:hypothetical protein
MLCPWCPRGASEQERGRVAEEPLEWGSPARPAFTLNCPAGGR